MLFIVGNGAGGATATPDITADAAPFGYSDYCAVSITSTRARFTRPTADGQGYETCNPGARVRFVTNASTLTYYVQYTNRMLRNDVYQGTVVTLANGSVVDSVTRGAGAAGSLEQTINFGSSTSRTVEILMPYCASVDFLGIDLPGGATFTAAAARPTNRYVAGGDSITHGFFASNIVHEWPYLVAVANSFQLINHGYGGRQCQPADGAAMAGLTPTLASYLIGYNNFAAQTPLAVFKSNYAAFVANFRAGAPSAKLYCVTPTWTPNVRPLTIEMYRQQIRDVVATSGDPKNILVEGLTLFTNSADRLQDGIHPNDLGSTEMAAALAAVLVP